MAPRHRVEDEPAKVKELQRRIDHARGQANGIGKFSFSSKQSGDVTAVSREVAEDWFLTEACYRRYLRARNWDVAKAEKMLLNTLAWRERFQPERLRWEDVQEEASTGKMYRSSERDADGAPVIVMRPRYENTKSHEGNIKHLVYHLEHTANLLQSERSPVEKFTWVIDMKGYSSRNAPPWKTSMETLSVLQNHYPERLGKAVLYCPPSLFHTFWRLISPFVDPVTKQKVIFASESKAPTLLKDVFDMENLESSLGGLGPYEPYSHEEYTQQMNEEDELIESVIQGSDLGAIVRNGEVFYEAPTVIYV